MDKICEFCAALKPVVYCKADAAFLCLSCDAKVHSANSLSSRHLRTLLCDSCRNRPAYAWCLDHRTFVCHGCDQSIHRGFSQHQKRTLSSFTGCPSAKDFASLWGFALDEAQPSSLRTSKKLLKGQKQENMSFILQQILDLKKLQLTEMDNASPVVSSLQQTDVSSSVIKTSEKFCDPVDLEHQCRDNDHLIQDPLPSLFSQSENLPTASASPLVDESFWSQNMQDLGVCEDVLCHDDFNIPDVDITFRNFEELFGTEQEPDKALLDENNMSLDKSRDRVSEKIEDTAATNRGLTFSGGPDRTMRQSYSTMSRFSECLDGEVSPFITEAEVSCHSADLERLLSDSREVTMKNRMKEKRTRKAGSDVRKRVKGRVGKTEDYDSDSIDVTRSN